MERRTSSPEGSAPLQPERSLPAARSVLAVCAHPDDESFGLGAALAALAGAGASVSVLSLTRGEASTLHADADLASVRRDELAAAGRALGASHVLLLDHPDGGLDGVPLSVLAADVLDAARAARPDLLVAFDAEGVTGHADHRRATAAAVASARLLRVPVLAWGVAAEVATRLNAELGTAFSGRPSRAYDLEVVVDRARQLDAIACHRSQSAGNTVLWRRLELQGDLEHFTWLA